MITKSVMFKMTTNENSFEYDCDARILCIWEGDRVLGLVDMTSADLVQMRDFITEIIEEVI